MDVTIDSKVIGQRLQKIRKSKGLTQAEMATHLNLQTSSYGNFERGSEMPSLKKVIQCCVILGVSPDVLLGDCCIRYMLRYRPCLKIKRSTREKRRMHRMDVCEQHLTELFQEYYLHLVYVCLRSFNYNSVFVPYIDDCIQNTFMAAIKKYDIFSKAANQEAWLKNACQKECFNLIRKTQRRRERLKEVTSCADEENFAIVQDAILFWLEQQDAQENSKQYVHH